MAYRIRFGLPEEKVPSTYCKNFSYSEEKTTYDTDKIHFEVNARGCLLEFPIREKERFYGLGLQLKAFELTSKKFVTRVNADPVSATGDSHAPVPFFVSTLGYGIYFDTARYVEFEFGRKKKDSESGKSIAVSAVKTSAEELYATREVGQNAVVSVQIPAAKGIDIYIFEGENITDVVGQYNMLAGGGCVIPDWGLGTYYRCYGPADQEKVENIIRYFKENDMPLSVVGLEPGWQTAAYPCSFIWNKALFPNPEKFVKNVYAQGLHLNLWQHAFVDATSDMYADLRKYSGNYTVWNGLVPDFADEKARKIFADYHKKAVVFGLIDGFKLDECDGSDYTGGWTFPLCSSFPSGVDGEQYHSLFGTLYMQTILKALGGQPTYSSVRNAGALASSYPFVLYSDLYEYNDFLRGLCTCGLSGLLWTPEVRHADTAEEFLKRLQMTVFSPQCLINGWYCEELPFIKFGIEKEVRLWLKEREKLKPRLKKAFELYQTTGKAVVRPLVSDYSDDEETFGIDTEYLLGEDLLVAPAFLGESEREIYLPEGKWRDYFTGEMVESGRRTVATNKIAVFEKMIFAID